MLCKNIKQQYFEKDGKQRDEVWVLCGRYGLIVYLELMSKLHDLDRGLETVTVTAYNRFLFLHGGCNGYHAGIYVVVLLHDSWWGFYAGPGLPRVDSRANVLILGTCSLSPNIPGLFLERLIPNTMEKITSVPRFTKDEVYCRGEFQGLWLRVTGKYPYDFNKVLSLQRVISETGPFPGVKLFTSEFFLFSITFGYIHCKVFFRISAGLCGQSNVLLPGA
jgi:hypothetical protein